jgi:hypothetical protein
MLKEFVIKLTVRSSASSTTYLDNINVQITVNSVTMTLTTNSSGVVLFRARNKNFLSSAAGTALLTDPAGVY